MVYKLSTHALRQQDVKARQIYTHHTMQEKLKCLIHFPILSSIHFSCTYGFTGIQHHLRNNFHFHTDAQCCYLRLCLQWLASTRVIIGLLKLTSDCKEHDNINKLDLKHSKKNLTKKNYIFRGPWKFYRISYAM